MKKRGTLPALGFAFSLLLAPAPFAQQELIDPQPPPGEEGQPLPSSPAAPEPAPPPAAQEPEKPAPPSQPALPLATSKPARQETLLSSSTIVGAPVKNPQGEELGTIKELMIDPQSGRVAHAVLAFGGVWGMNEKSMAIPWETLKVGLGKEELVVELTKEQLQNAPSGELSQQPTPADR